MWRGRPTGDRTVSCIACGTSLPRGEAREYDKEGDRWDREGKRFEYLCKDCFRDLSKEPRDGVEATLVDVGAGRLDREEFVSAYLAAVEGEREAD
ncbi:MAG: hypothetical protein ABEH77_09530 [Halobacteriaceae archaeon]